MSQTTQRLIELASTRFKVELKSLNPQQDFLQALEINSIQALELLSDLEDEFDVEIPDYELQGVSTFQGLAELIEKRQ